MQYGKKPTVNKKMLKIKAPFSPTGDQPEAIRKLTNGILNGDKHQCLLGVTGSETFTIANVIEQTQKPSINFMS